MAGHEGSTERRDGLFTDEDVQSEDWGYYPEPSWLAGPEPDAGVPSGPGSESVDAGEHRFGDGVDALGEDPLRSLEPALPDTYGVPGFDLGPQTESVVVDLTRNAATRRVQLADVPHESERDVPPPAEHDVRTQAEHDVRPQAESLAPVERRSRHAAPTFAVPPLPTPGQVGAETLTAATVLRSRRARPQSGWRKRVLTMTGGKVNLGLSPADRHRADLLAKARTAVKGTHRVAVISLKGGVGKTTTTAALGSMFANLRGDRVIAVDANPDRGTLAERVPRESGATIRHLLHAREQVTRYGDIRAFTSQSPTRLEVLASDSDPSASSALSEQDYIDTIETLERFYNLVLTDCGTGLLHDAMRGVLGMANSLVVVSSASLDGARSASATLDWLEAHGLGSLAKEAVVVISSVRPGGGIVDVMQLEDHFASRCRAVVTIPYDPHLEAGGVLDLDELDDETVDAYRELAAAVAEGFSAPGGR